ncbi:MAG TPA: tripartite tricarboxylate transporter TctB family protein [Burkholderiales bacterium]|nr:tripartite tricarboxylate transporter TctB family protein [Burkholderiales bacterium]
MKLSKDGWTGLVVLAASLVLFGFTIGLRDNPLVPIGPGFYPRIVLGLTAALALVLIVSDLVAAKVSRPATAVNRTLVFTVFAIFGVYAAALPLLGFRIATLLFMVALQSTLERPRTAKGWMVVAATALITTVVSYVLFERYLQVLLPRGRWTDF